MIIIDEENEREMIADPRSGDLECLRERVGELEDQVASTRRELARMRDLIPKIEKALVAKQLLKD